MSDDAAPPPPEDDGVDTDVRPEDVRDSGQRAAAARAPDLRVVGGSRAKSLEERPPCDLDAEAAVLSAVMTDAALLDKTPDLRPEHFYSESHRRIFEACLSLRDKGQPIDTVQVASELRAGDRLQQVGGVAYLMEVQQSAPVVVNIAAYAATVMGTWRARQITQVTTMLRAQAYVGLDPTRILQEGIKLLEALSPPPSSGVELVYGAALKAPVPAPEFLVRELRMVAGPGAPHLVAGYGGSGKTMAMQSLAVAMFMGLPIWGAYGVQQRRRIVHVDYEQGDSLTRRRYQRLSYGMGTELPDDDDGMATVSHPPDLRLNESCKSRWRALMTDRDLVIIDSLKAATAGMDENSSDIRQPLDMLGELSAKTGCRAVVIHHARKPKEDSPGRKYSLRGSSAIFDALDCVYVFSGEKLEPIEVSQEKARSVGSEIDDFVLTIEDVRSETQLDAGVMLQQRPREYLAQRREQRETRQREQRVRSDAQAIRRIVTENPGITATDLRNRAGMAGTRVSAAITELGSAVEERSERRGPGRSSVVYYMRGAAPGSPRAAAIEVPRAQEDLPNVPVQAAPARQPPEVPDDGREAPFSDDDQ